MLLLLVAIVAVAPVTFRVMTPAVAIILRLIRAALILTASVPAKVIVALVAVARGLPLLPLVMVAEHLVSVLNLLKLLSCAPLRLIRVVLLRHFVIRQLDFLVTGVLVHL